MTHLAAMLTGAAALGDWLIILAAAVALGLFVEAALRCIDDRADVRAGRALVERGEAARARGRAG